MANQAGELMVRVGADIREAQRGLQQIERELKQLGGAAGLAGQQVDRATGEMERGATRAAGAFSKLDARVLDGLRLGALAAGAAVVSGLGLAAKSAAEFEANMRNVNSIAQLGQQEFEAFGQSVLQVADNPQIRQGPLDLSKALYDVVSSGFEGRQALDVLRDSALGASAGMTDTATSGRGLMAVLNSGISGVSGSREAMDVLFKIVDRGVVSFEQLSGSIGSVLPTAAKAGLSLQEIGAFIAIATKQGQSGAEAINDLNNVITKILRPSSEAARLMQGMGISYGLSALQAKGLAGILDEVARATKGNEDALALLFPDMQAFRGVLTALSQDGQLYTRELLEMSKAGNDVGAMQRALTEQNKSAAAQWELLTKELSLFGLELSGGLLPLAPPVIGFLRDLVAGVRALPNELNQVRAAFRGWFDWLQPVASGLGGIVDRIKEMAARVPGLSTVLEEMGKGARNLPFIGPLIGAGQAVGEIAGAGRKQRPVSDVPRIYRPAPKTGPGIDALFAPHGMLDGLTDAARSRLEILDDLLAAQGLTGAITSGRRNTKQRSKHNDGTAIDTVFGGDMQSLAAWLRTQGFDADFERKGQRNANGSVATGDHLHIDLLDRVSQSTAPIYGFDPDRNKKPKAAKKPKKTDAQKAAEKAERDRQKMLEGEGRYFADRQTEELMEQFEADLRIYQEEQKAAETEQQYRSDRQTDALMEQFHNDLRIYEDKQAFGGPLPSGSRTQDLTDAGKSRVKLGAGGSWTTPSTTTPGQTTAVAWAKDVEKSLADAQRWRDQMKVIAGDVRGVFHNAFGDLFQRGFKGFFDSVLGGFRQMLNQMAADYLSSRLVQALFGSLAGGGGKGLGLLGGVVQGIFGPIKGLKTKAFGGRAYSDSPQLVGEDGPELFMPDRAGTIVPNHRMAGAGAGAGTVVFNITTPDVAGFRHSQAQLYQDAWRHGYGAGHRY